MLLPRYTLRQLDAFTTVAHTLSFTAAADRLALTPSAVSQLVVELKSSAGFKLFERSTRRVALTAADLRNRAAGLVRVAAPMVIASAMLPRAIRDYAALRPKIVVRIRDAAVEQLVEMVASGDVDLAIGPDRPTGDDVQRVSLFQSPWVLWCAPDHPLAATMSVAWRKCGSGCRKTSASRRSTWPTTFRRRSTSPQQVSQRRSPPPT